MDKPTRYNFRYLETGESPLYADPAGCLVRTQDHEALARLAADLLRANNELSSENFDLKADAARYRWLRSDGFEYVRVQDLTCDTSDIGLDHAIDRRISVTASGEQK